MIPLLIIFLSVSIIAYAFSSDVKHSMIHKAATAANCLSYDQTNFQSISFVNTSSRTVGMLNVTYGNGNATLAAITLRGYFISGANTFTPSSMTIKDNDDCETGVGTVNDIGRSREIDKHHFIQIDFSSLRLVLQNDINSKYSAQLTISSVQYSNQEGFAIYGSNQLGALGELVYNSTHGVSNCNDTFPIPGFSNLIGSGFNYYSVTADGTNIYANVLLESLLLRCQPLDVLSTRPTYKPSKKPSTKRPTKMPSMKPENIVTSSVPTSNPSLSPTVSLRYKPSRMPSEKPSYSPSVKPSYSPSVKPSYSPSVKPSYRPSVKPSYRPSVKPSYRPSVKPSTYFPSLSTYEPTSEFTIFPTEALDVFTVVPSFLPTLHSTNLPSVVPSKKLSFKPTKKLSKKPTMKPSLFPSYYPTPEYMTSSVEPTSSKDTLQCTPYKFIFNTPACTLGTTYNFTAYSTTGPILSTATIIARGYEIVTIKSGPYGVPITTIIESNMTLQDTSPCQTGLYFLPQVNPIIKKKPNPYFIQFDLFEFINVIDLKAEILIASSHNNNTFHIYGSNTKGSLGNLINTNTSTCPAISIPIITFLNTPPYYRYYSVKANFIPTYMVVYALNIGCYTHKV